MPASIRKIVFALLVLNTLASVSARAAVLGFADDKAGFMAAGGTSIGALPPSGRSGTVVGPITFTNGGGGASIVFGTWSNEIAGYDLAISGPENFNLAIAGGTYGIGFDMHEPTTPGVGVAFGCNSQTCVDSPYTIEIFAGSTSLGSFAYNAPDDTSTAAGGPLGFFGVRSSQLFDRVQVRDLNGNIDNEYFGNFLTNATALPVPEPPAVALFALGLAVLHRLRRRGV